LLLASMAPAQAVELRQLREGPCIEAVSAGYGLAGGIATPGLEAEPLATLCDGRLMRIGLKDGALVFRPFEGIVRKRDPSAGRTGELPDGQETHGPERIAAAWLIGPTDIYGHGILGDGIEASGFRFLRKDGVHFTYRLDGASVYEDLRVRLVDLNDDGTEEALLIRSYLDRGAALAVYDLRAGGPRPLGESPAIGLPNRWLNPAGAADFDGDGLVEVAIVETPHIGGILKFFQLHEDGLRLEHRAEGFSNHAIGSRVLDLSAVLDWNADGVPDLALPDAGRRHLKVVSLAGGSFTVLATLAADAPIAGHLVATDLDADGGPELLYLLADGTLLLASP
jgi:hypothetical protein